MAEAILMPRLSDTMTEGVIAAWHKNVGDAVKKGDLLAEIETDKATMELESYQDGILLHQGTPNGGKIQVNELLAIFGKAGEDISALIAQHAGGAKPEAAAPKPEVKRKRHPNLQQINRQPINQHRHPQLQQINQQLNQPLMCRLWKKLY